MAYDIRPVEWSELSDTRLTDTGRQALAVYKDAWQHAETAHFVYHFRDAKEAQTVLVHAESYYQWVKDLFGASGEEAGRKSHIFVFDEKPLWDSFKERTPEKLPGAEAFTNGFELFLYREPFWLAPQRVLAHEITHLVLFRFVKGEVPLFLNEGFAELMATKAVAMKTDGDQYRVRVFQKIPEDQFIPPKEFVAIDRYPREDTEVFYLESELLTRFLMLNHPPQKYHELLKETASGRSFEEALKDLYGFEFEDFSEQFRLYAVAGP